MKIYSAIALLAAASLPLGASAFGNLDIARIAADTTTTEPADTVGFGFRDIKVIPHTSVKDQNKSGTCWCFSGTSFIEDEILRQGGDSLDLSEMFTVRQCYLDKAIRYIRLYGQTNFAAGGSALDVPYVWKRYGAMPEEVYSGLQYGEEKHVHGELDAALKAYLDAIKANPNKKLSTAWLKGVEGILDAYLGEVPETFTYRGKTYTPRSYAESLPVNIDDYVSITSFTHHPFYGEFAVEVPDNWIWEKSLNLPMEEFKKAIIAQLQAGKVVWFGSDCGKYGDRESGIWDDRSFQVELITGLDEDMDKRDMLDSCESRMNHAMCLTGVNIGPDGKPNRWKIENSWGTDRVYDGYFMASDSWFDRFVYQAVVHKKYLGEKAALFDTQPVVLEPWDPIGSLAE